ncbi:MAG: asparagine synthase (glutamine-hydrolyzing) [Ferruginibacter sp.]|nr:asparagine synthase (glutamine-hydrolyzing) [Ferruginibacter sp.]
MCRIAGILSPSLPVTETGAMVKAMCDKQKHGGPDGEGIYADADNNLVLGHRRLALIDLGPGGHQPMSYNNGRYRITYNGELYNYTEIKKELAEAGCTFKSASDTEVILAAFAAWGTNAFKRFNGMFAFALWDSETATIYLVRDRWGIKPLYFAYTQQGLCFASEMRAFASIPWLQQENKNWPVFVLAYGHLPEPVTTMQHVKPLPKGSFLRCHCKTGQWDIELFAISSYAEVTADRNLAIEQVQNTLSAAVKRHLISDAPIGVFLSGGLDSSIIALLAGGHQPSGLKTLSIIFEEEKYSEKKYQNLVIEKLACPNWQETLTEKVFQQNLPGIINDMDMPGCDGINTWFISKYARESGLKAVLSGVGGDELFGGYPSFSRIGKVKWMEKIPSAFLKTGRYSGSKKLKRLSYLSLGGAKGIYLFLRGQFVPASIAKHLDATEKEVWQVLEEEPLQDRIAALSAGNQASWIESNYYMQNQLLRDADVMSMAHGVEIRVPFLDNELAGLVQGIRSDIKYSGSFPKQLLIDSFKKELPAPVWNRPKMGFSFPFTEWMQQSEFVKDTMSKSGSSSRASFEKFIKGDMHWSQLMSLLLLNVKH